MSGIKNIFKYFYVLSTALIVAACATGSTEVQSVYYNDHLENIEAKRFDNGKMWTFEDAPLEYFDNTYSFKPDEKWLEKVRMSSLKFASWCSSSFVSEDGLVMTNHHCVDFITDRIEQDGEDIFKNGFYAQSLEDERKIPGVFVSQLVYIEDVTEKVQQYMDKGANEEEKANLKNEIISQITSEYTDNTGNTAKVTPLYNGGRYSLYGYKKYNDVRAVYVAESGIGLYGGDPDNFTYPRYNCDFSFVRVYDEDGKPLKTENFYKWSENGPVSGEPLFVIGRPGSTERIKTVAQYVYMRDHSVMNRAQIFGGLSDALTELMAKKTDNFDKYQQAFMMVSNSAKVYENEYEALKNNKLMARKVSFENNIKEAVAADEKLNEKYGHIWGAIADLQDEKARASEYSSTYTISPAFTSDYIIAAQKALILARNMAKPENERPNAYLPENIDSTISAIYASIDADYGYYKLKINAGTMENNLGQNSDIYNKVFGGMTGFAAADYALEHSYSDSEEELRNVIKNGYQAILEGDDALIAYCLKAERLGADSKMKLQEISRSESVLEEELGRAVFAVYGTNIPPDATFTLRISDGIMKGYEYNGTVAPEHTTLYGLYNRYNSHDKKFPWDLPQKWIDAESKLDLSTPINFVSTHDITGGSSGSPVINKNAEIVGIAFDGNISSIAGSYLYDDEYNRMVSVHSEGIVEVLGKVYGATRIVDELRAGKIVETEPEAEPVTEPETEDAE